MLIISKLVDKVVHVFYILANLLSSIFVTIIIEFSTSSFDSVTFYFMTSWPSDCFMIMKYSLFMTLFLVLRYIFPDINIATPDFLWMLFAQYIVFLTFYFQPVCVLDSKVFSCRQRIVDSTCSFASNVLIFMVGFTLTILLFFSVFPVPPWHPEAGDFKFLSSVKWVLRKYHFNFFLLELYFENYFS